MSDLFGAPIALDALAMRLRVLYRSPLRGKRAVFLHGPPGIGKTSVTRAVADELATGYKRNNLVTTDYIQLCGLMDKEEGKRRKLDHPARISLLGIPERGGGLYVLDDYTHAQREIQNVALDLTAERRLNDSVLGPGWLLVFVGNDTGGVIQLAAGLANRFIHYYVLADLQVWKNWAFGAGILPQIIAFLESEPDAFSTIPKGEMAYGTPRSWHRASEDLALYCGELRPDDPMVHSVCASEVGTVLASRFVAYLRTYGLIDFPSIIKGVAPSFPDQVKDADPGVRDAMIHAMSYSLCAHVRGWWSGAKGSSIEYVAGVLGRVLGYISGSFATMLIRDIVYIDRKRAFKVLEHVTQTPGLSHVRDAFADLGRLQAGVGLD